MYNKRLWLNEDGSPSTGSVAAYYGISPYDKDEDKMTMVLEISDCSNKVHLHKSRLDTELDFINKMIKLRSFIDEFVGYLQSKNNT